MAFRTAYSGTHIYNSIYYPVRTFKHVNGDVFDRTLRKEGERMKILAIAPEGKEYIYKTSTAHKVAAKSATLIRDALNNVRYNLKPGYIWHLYDVDIYDPSHAYATMQKFTLRKGLIKEVLKY